jgi:hypothetical protein
MRVVPTDFITKRLLLIGSVCIRKIKSAGIMLALFLL